MATLLFMQRSELALCHRIPRSPPPCPVCILVSPRSQGGIQTFFWAVQPGPCRVLHPGEALSSINPSQLMGQLVGRRTSMEVDLDVQGAVEVILHKGLLILVPEGALCEQGLLLLPSKASRWKCPLCPKLPFARDLQTDGGQRSRWR